MQRALLSLAAAGCLFAAAPDFTVPADYRDWVFLSSGVGMTYGPAKALLPDDHPAVDNVFVNPEAYRYFKANGTWPGKTTLVLEIRQSETAGSINHGGFFQGGKIALELHVKDTKFDGAWCFFNEKGEMFPATAECYSCHQQHGAVDTTFVQFYPTLLPIAKEKGTLSASYLK